MTRLQNYLINEAVPLSIMKQFKDIILGGEYKSYLNHVFKGQDRIYLPLKGESKLETGAPQPIQFFLSKEGYEIVDYPKGIAKNKEGRLIKIGKLLNKKGETELLKSFQLDKNRQSSTSKERLVVISRHPYDLAGMSTGRGWTSCMSLPKGIYSKYVRKDMEKGTLVAYVVDTNDKNINSPTCRLLIKPFINAEDKNDIVLYPEKKIYGTDVNGFRETVIKWLDTFQRVDGTLYKKTPSLYNDDDIKHIGTGDKHGTPIYKNLYYKNNPNDPDAKNEQKEIRLAYYENNPNDPDAKNDKYEEIRMIYYKNHPNDPDAKKDKALGVRMLYYKNHPNDPDAKKDKSYIAQAHWYKNHPDDNDWKKIKHKTFRSVLELMYGGRFNYNLLNVT
jgi:hypothetical protein